jgi:PAS domain-containing protein
VPFRAADVGIASASPRWPYQTEPAWYDAATEVRLTIQDTLASLRDRAVLATEVSFTISDPTQPDNPLVWVNPAFSRITGYDFEEAVGRNCRLLQGPATDPAAVAELGAALAEQRPTVVTLVN